MTRILVHIGHPKTGSTALQFTLRALPEQLARAGVLYPEIAPVQRHKHAVLLPTLLGKATPALRRSSGVDGAELATVSATAWAALGERIAAVAPRTTVLSGESFWNPRSAEAARSMCARLRTLADRVEVAGYVRSPTTFFLSQVNQNIKMFGAVKKLRPDFYRSAIEAHAAGGFDRLSFRLFDRSALIGGDVVEDFRQSYLPEIDAPLDAGPAVRGNVSLSTEALKLVQCLQAKAGHAIHAGSGPTRTSLIRLVQSADAHVPGRVRPSLRPEVADAIVARSLDLPWLRDSQGIVFPDIDYARISARPEVELEQLQEIEDLCPLDAERLAVLRAEVDRRRAALGSD